MQLILASGSPRRIKLLTQLGVDFTSVNTDAREVILDTPEETCIHNAIRKVKWVLRKEKKSSVVAGFDTIVYFKNRILGKPDDREESFNMLRELSGNWHLVYTGVAVWTGDSLIHDYDVSEVKFYKLTSSQLQLYISSGKTLDKAGSYGIQDENISFIQKIRGDFTNVVGLPIEVSRKLLKKAGVKI